MIVFGITNVEFSMHCEWLLWNCIDIESRNDLHTNKMFPLFWLRIYAFAVHENLFSIRRTLLWKRSERRMPEVDRSLASSPSDDLPTKRATPVCRF